MIICPECNHNELAGSLFCGNCGALLFSDQEKDSDTDELPEKRESPRYTAPPLVGQRAGPAASAKAIRFRIPSSGREITLGTQGKIRMGRADPRNEDQPDLDLTEDGGAEAGVSRMHASISTTGQGIAIMDLDSVNGTRVNDQRLPPHLPFALNDGDTLYLGDLLIQVFFEG